jgi:hypothetical protein
LRLLFNIINDFIILNMNSISSASIGSASIGSASIGSASIGTTSIDALPVGPQSQMQGPPQENIRLEVDNSVSKLQQSREADILQAQQAQAQQAQVQAQQTQGQNTVMSQQNMNQFVSGLQQASSAGLTTLPSRDIPQTQSHLTQDQHMQPNYVPQERQNIDYITDYQTNEEIIRRHAQKEQSANNLDNLYNNLQTPILIAILYFMFQLPVVRKNIFKFMPSLFNKDGNPNLMGYLINSAIFASLYFTMTKGIHYFSV